MSKVEGQIDRAPVNEQSGADSARAIVQQQQGEQKLPPPTAKAEREPGSLDLSANIYQSNISPVCTEANPYGRKLIQGHRQTAAAHGVPPASEPSFLDTVSGKVSIIQSNLPGNEIAAIGSRIKAAVPRAAMGNLGTAVDATMTGVHLYKGNIPAAINTAAKASYQYMGAATGAFLCAETGPGAIACAYVGATAAGLYYDVVMALGKRRAR